MNRLKWQFLLLVALCVCVSRAVAQTDDANVPRSFRAEWMYEGSYGLMVHYLISPQGETAEARTADFNKTVDSFDVDAFIEQFKATGADWLIFTIGQNTGYYCSPNMFLDRHAPGHTSDRDLVAEVARRVKELNKWFVAYLPAEVAGQSEEIKTAFAWRDDDHTDYLDRYLQFVKDYSHKYGQLCDGWWFDGCYDHVHKGRWDWQRWVDAVRAGNWYSAVAFSDATFCIGRTEPVTPLQDYLAGEVHLLENNQIRTDFLATGGEIYKTPEGYLRLRGQEPGYHMPSSRCVKGVQWHALVPIDSSFAAPAIPDQHYEDDMLFPFVLNCRDVGGAVTLNVPISPQGKVPDSTVAQLARLNAEIRKQMASQEPRHSPVKDEGTTPAPLEDVQPHYNMAVFRTALEKGQWEKALSMCSTEAQARAADYASPEAFLKDMIPLDELLSGRSLVGVWPTHGYLARVDILRVGDRHSTWGMFLKQEEGDYRFDFPPITAPEYMAAAKAAMEYAQSVLSNGEAEYKPAAAKLSVALVFDQTEYLAGEPIPCSLVLTNASDKHFTINAPGFNRYCLSIVDSNGAHVAAHVPPMQFSSRHVELKAGQTADLPLSPNIAEEHKILKEPGEYSITYTGHELRPLARVPLDEERAKDPWLQYFGNPFPGAGGWLTVGCGDSLPPSNTVKIMVRSAQ